MPLFLIGDKMAFTCTLYYYTGFNPVNVPDSPTLLNTCTHTDFPALQILQERFLNTVRIKGTWDQVKDGDYCKVGNFYYFINGISMQATDVAVLDLIPDFLTSAGGANSLTYLDGITVRHNVAEKDDTFGRYDEADAYLTPTMPLEITSSGWLEGMADDDKPRILIESTLDLYEMSKEDYKKKNSANYYQDGDGNGVTVPSTLPITECTSFEMADESHTSPPNGTELYYNDTKALHIEDTPVSKGMQICRDLGVESAIISQYTIPSGLYDGTERMDDVEGPGADDPDGVQDPDPKTRHHCYTKLTGKTLVKSSNLPFTWGTFRNKRVLYGDNCKYGIITAAGNSAEFDPEQIYKSGDASPSVTIKVDPRPDGKPYFRFQYYLGSSSNFWINAIGGEAWRHVPLIYNQAQGNVQSAYNFQSKMTQEKNTRHNALYNDFSKYAQDMVNGYADTAGNLADAANPLNIAAGNSGRYASKAARSAINMGFETMNLGVNQYYKAQAYKLTKQNELYNYGVSQSVVAPSVALPFYTGTLRDYVGNSAWIYRYHPSAIDAQRMDKILSMYGYKHTAAFDKAYLTNKPYFNYIEVTGLTIGGSLPQWWKQGIQEQLSTGTRIWHVLPDPKYYTMQ